jgi:hypothetical protein
MAYIRKKRCQSGGRDLVYHFVVRSVRDGRRVKQVTLATLSQCETITARIADREQCRDAVNAKLDAATAELDALKTAPEERETWGYELRQKSLASELAHLNSEIAKLKALQAETGLP